MNSGKMLMAIVNKGDAKMVMEALRASGARGGTIINAHGTAPTSILAMLGLGDKRKEVLLSMIDCSIEKRCLDSLKGLKTKGVVTLLGKGGDESMKEWVMVQVICEYGYADDIMAAARKEGAKGGTILKGHGTAKEDDTKFFGYQITAEKEILLIIEEKNKAERIIDSINNLPFLAKKGKAVIFSLPVSHFSTIS